MSSLLRLPDLMSNSLRSRQTHEPLQSVLKDDSRTEQIALKIEKRDFT